MADDTDNQDAQGEAADSPRSQAGQRLAEARKKQQISVLEVAKELHLDERKVFALEANEFDVLGAPVFAKGHLKKYARLVGVSIDDVMADYYQLNRSSGMPPVVGKVRKPARELAPGPWIVGVAVLIVVTTAYWYFVALDPATGTESADAVETPEPVDSGPAVDPSVGQATDVPVDAEPTVTDNIAEPDLGVAGSGTDDDAAERSVQDTAAAVAEPAVQPVPNGEVRMTMSFSGDCWTEITDAAGQRLFFDLGRDGRRVSVSGQAPLSVLFGNADNVSLSVNGSDYAIAASSRRGQTARLTIDRP